jgi:hypothetical protein
MSRRTADVDTDMEEEAPAPTSTSVYPVAKPEPFDGTRAKLEDWLMKFDLFFMFQGERIPEEKRVTFVATFMKDQAFTWIKPFLRRYHGEGASTDIDPWIEDFDLFKEQIRQVFGVHNEPTIARRKIQHLRQTTSAADYAAEFQQLATYTGWDDTALATMFRQGLKPKVKEELMRTAASTENYDDLVNEAISIDIKLHELQQELREDHRARVVVSAVRPPQNQWRNNNLRRGQRGNHYQSNVGRRIHNNTSSGHYGPEAMDLSNLNKGSERWNQKKDKGSQGKDKSQVTCYGCGKQGHFARDCRSKNKVVRQLNVLTSGHKDDDADASEWEILTEDVGRLMEDKESGSEEDPEEYIDSNERYDRAPTPYQETEEPVLQRKHAPRMSDREEEAYFKAIDAYHDSQSWTACYDDACTVHYSDKLGAGWFPSRPWQRRLKNVQHDEYIDKCDRILEALKVQRTALEERKQNREKRTREEWDQLTGINYSPRHGMALPPSPPKEEEDEFQEAQEHATTEGTEQAQACIKFGEKSTRGVNRQIANAKITREEWRKQAFDKWARNNHASMSRIQQVNDDQPSTLAPDFKRTEVPILTDTVQLHRMDTRNQDHHKLPWFCCVRDSCEEHYDMKIRYQDFPTKTWGCDKDWYDCEHTMCVEHIWDKRTTVHFPGMTTPDDVLRMQLVLNGSCANTHWQECLNPECRRHEREITQHGFSEEPFLDRGRKRAPGIDPSIPSGPIHSSSSRSN